jgi:hypothetical protein
MGCTVVPYYTVRYCTGVVLGCTVAVHYCKVVTQYYTIVAQCCMVLGIDLTVVLPVQSSFMHVPCRRLMFFPASAP